MFHPKSNLKLIESAGHQLMVDNAAAVNHAILSFTHSQQTADVYKVAKDGVIAAAAAKTAKNIKR